MLKRLGDAVPGGSSCPALLRIYILSQELLGTRDEGRVKVRSASCSNTLDYRRGPHPSTPDCSPVRHVSAGTLQEKRKEKKV